MFLNGISPFLDRGLDARNEENTGLCLFVFIFACFVFLEYFLRQGLVYEDPTTHWPQTLGNAPASVSQVQEGRKTLAARSLNKTGTDLNVIPDK